ncbi:MAG: dihydroorotase [Candidatus Dormibacteraceae bacterium]
MTWDLQITGGILVDANGRFPATLAVQEGRIAAILSHPDPSARRTINALGLHVLPGMVDQHVHFMDPGPTDREDFITGSSAAAVGGVTTVAEHTHSNPILTVADLESKREHLSNRSLVDFGLVAHAFPDTVGEAAALWRAGIAYVKAFTCTTHGVPALMPDQLLALFRNLQAVGGRAMVHCEDEFITGADERRLHLLGRTDNGIISEWRSREAELTAVSVTCMLAVLSGARVTVAHASNPAVVELVRAGRRSNPGLTVEACPQYLHLTSEEHQAQGPLRKFTPPARSPEDRAGMRQLLAAGQLDLVGTDHAPSTRAQKLEGDIWSCPFGLPGVETTLRLLLNACADGWLTLEQVVALFSRNPARLLGLHPAKGSLEVGSDADLVLVDLAAAEAVSAASIVSKAGWSPYEGMTLRGRPVMTLVRGEVVAEGGAVAAAPGWGRFVSRATA